MIRVVLGAVVALLFQSQSILAWTHGSALVSRPVGMNLSAVSGGEGVFINNLKNCGSLSSTAGYAFPLILNDDGYPTSVPMNTLTCSVSAMPAADNPEWTVGWSGTLKINLQGPSGTTIINADPGLCVVSNTSGNLTLGGTNCTVRFTYASAPNSLGVQFPSSGTYTSPSGLYMVRSDEKTIFDSGEIFRPVSAGMLVAKLVDLGISTPRFLDWQNLADQNNVSQWSFLGSPTSFSYAGTRWERTVFGATPIIGMDTYAGPATSGSTSTYVDGQVYQNIVTNGNTVTTPTLSIGGGPAVTIVQINGAAMSTSIGSGGRIADNTLSTFVYNAKANKWFWTSGALQSRVPVQIQTALCNKLATLSAAILGCWYEFPQMYTQASMASHVAYVRDNLSPALIAYYEYSNEVFNPSATPRQFAQTVGDARLFPDTTQNYKDEFALQHRIAMGIVTDNWAPRSMSTLQRVMSWSTQELPSNLLIILGTSLKFDASGSYCNGGGCTITTRYDSVGSCSALNTTSGRPVDCADAFAFAPYYSGAQIAWCSSSCSQWSNTMTEAIQAADDYASGNPTLMSAALDFVDCDVRGVPTIAYPNCGSKNGTPGGDTLLAFSKVGGTADNYNTLATTWGKTVINYEGAYQGSPPTAARLTTLGITSSSLCGTAACVATEFTNLINAYKADARFTQLVYDQMTQMKAYSNFRMPTWFVMGPATSSSTAAVWALYVGTTLTVTPTKAYDGVKNFARGGWLLKRDLNPASNDNDPMWLRKAA